jgi:hypothetical protein
LMNTALGLMRDQSLFRSKSWKEQPENTWRLVPCMRASLQYTKQT